MATFTTWGMSGTVATQQPGDEVYGLERVEFWIDEFNASVNRFREDSELSRINARSAGTFSISPLLERALQSARRSGEISQNLCDPTVLSSLEKLGYDRDYDELLKTGVSFSTSTSPAPGPQSWSLDALEHTVTLEAGVRLDLGASAKALFADVVVNELAQRGGALVEIGGDVAVHGVGPDGPWVIGVASSLEIGGNEPRISIGGGAIATSSRVTRTWTLNGRTVNHIIDPRTGLCANGPYAVATVAGPNCVDANALATAALLWGEDASYHIAQFGAAARLIRDSGEVEFVGGWTREEST